MGKNFAIGLWLLAGALLTSCDRGAPSNANDADTGFSTDAEVFEYISETDPSGFYTLFPHADSVVAGSLNGSTAHRPFVRVSLNAAAVASLTDGRFPAGGSFRDSSVVFKEVKDSSGKTTLIAVAVKQANNSQAANGWLWAEYKTDGSVVYTIQNKGTGCIGCHSLEQGPQHDYIRTFERQTP